MLQREIKSCETQGDALLQDFREQLSERLMGSLSRTDLSTIAMSMDDSLDVIKDAAKAVQIYKPRKIDQQLQDLAQLIRDEAYALQKLLPLIWHIRDKASAISLLCDRVTEMEHAADDAYEEYIGYIFAEEADMREMTKYKNLAEILEKATDSQKHVADCVRLMVMRFVRGLVHPRTSIGGGARRIQVPACGDAGDVGRGRSEAESPGHHIYLQQTKHKKPGS